MLENYQHQWNGNETVNQGIKSILKHTLCQKKNPLSWLRHRGMRVESVFLTEAFSSRKVLNNPCFAFICIVFSWNSVHILKAVGAFVKRVSIQHHSSLTKGQNSPKTFISCFKTKLLTRIKSQCPQNEKSLWHCVNDGQNV